MREFKAQGSGIRGQKSANCLTPDSCSPTSTVLFLATEPGLVHGEGITMAKRGVPEGLWIRCPQCKATIFRKEAESRFNVCPECRHHFYLPARDRIKQLLDEESFEEWFTDLRP